MHANQFEEIESDPLFAKAAALTRHNIANPHRYLDHADEGHSPTPLWRNMAIWRRWRVPQQP